jgi:hypothetical protein
LQINAAMLACSVEGVGAARIWYPVSAAVAAVAP